MLKLNKDVVKELFPNIEEKKFKLTTEMRPSGDQINAIKELCDGLGKKESNQVLLGVTGSGKTFTMANVINIIQKPSLIMAPNKTLAAQLYGEMKLLFPNNAVEYFVSYYDYYQPEAYVPRTDTFIEKDASINEHIDRMRHSATRSLFERNDVIIVASVSCIYGLGPVETYSKMILSLCKGLNVNKPEGAFYIFPSCSELIGLKTVNGIILKDDSAFCEYLIEEAGVAVVPGIAFGKKDYFRISYATSEELLIKAGNRIKNACEKIN